MVKINSLTLFLIIIIIFTINLLIIINNCKIESRENFASIRMNTPFDKVNKLLIKIENQNNLVSENTDQIKDLIDSISKKGKAVAKKNKNLQNMNPNSL